MMKVRTEEREREFLFNSKEFKEVERERDRKQKEKERKDTNIFFVYIITRTSCGPVVEERRGEWEVMDSNLTSYQSCIIFGIFGWYGIPTVHQIVYCSRAEQTNQLN